MTDGLRAIHPLAVTDEERRILQERAARAARIDKLCIARPAALLPLPRWCVEAEEAEPGLSATRHAATLSDRMAAVRGICKDGKC